MNLKAILACLIMSIFATPAFAEDYDTGAHNTDVAEKILEKPGAMSLPWKSFFFNLDAGAEINGWSVNKDNSTPALKYKTEGLNVMRLASDIGFGQKNLLTVTYERPFKDTDRQNEMLATSGTSTEGMEKFVGGIKLDPIMDMIFTEGTLTQNMIRKLLSVRFKYTEETYFTDATAIKDTLYLPSTALLDYQTLTVSGTQNLSAGQQLVAKTRITEREISIPLFTFDLPIYLNGKFLRAAPHDLRIGQYVREWSRPSDTSSFTITGLPVAYNADYKSNGIVVAVETTDIGFPGINADFSFKFGYNDSLNSPIDWAKLTNEKIDTSFVGINVGLWYNYYFNTERYKGLGMTLGGSWTKTAMNVEIVNDTSTTVTTSRLVHDTDEFYKYYLNLQYRF